MEEAKFTPNTLLVFIDETGNEDFSDPKNPTFGRGGCAIESHLYRTHLKKPWRSLKREKLGGAKTVFHATQFEQSAPTPQQIGAINRFLHKPFWRFAAMADSRTQLPSGIDGHKAISLVTIQFIRKLVSQKDVLKVALIFEKSDRGDTLVKRDFSLENMRISNRAGKVLEVDGYFIDKESMEAGLEISDLVVHTAARQRRHEVFGNEGTKKDFQHMFWHSPIPPYFMAINSIELNELALGEKSQF